MFIGRERELEQLCETFKQKHSATLVYGKRRVGKTTLIMQALGKQNKPYVYYECLKGTMRENIDGLTQQLTQLKLLTFATTFSTMRDVFAYLNSLSRELIVVIDEYLNLLTFSLHAQRMRFGICTSSANLCCRHCASMIPEKSAAICSL